MIERFLMRLRPAFLASFVKRILRIKARKVLTTHGQFEVDPVSFFGRALIVDGEYEGKVSGAIVELLSDGQVFIDIGANNGYFSVLASQYVGGDGLVLAIEPQARLIPKINQNCRLNHCTNVFVVCGAVSDENGWAEIHLPPDVHTGGASFLNITRYQVPTQVTRCWTLDELMSRFSVEGDCVVKIDVEGFEREVVGGSIGRFHDGSISWVILETHPTLLERRGFNAEDIIGQLVHAGFEEIQKYGLVHIFRRKKQKLASPIVGAS